MVGSSKKDKRTGKKKKTPVPDTYSDDEDGDHRMDEGMGFFSADDEYELMCQGVKPWDDDAAVSPYLDTELVLMFYLPGRACCVERRLLLTGFSYMFPTLPHIHANWEKYLLSHG
jgi:hypothetical protein